MIIKLLKSRISSKELSLEYALDVGLISRWRREYEEKSGNLSKKKEFSN